MLWFPFPCTPCLRILDDAVAQKWISNTISLYFAENKKGEVGMGSIWEGHKAVVQGELISQGSPKVLG